MKIAGHACAGSTTPSGAVRVEDVYDTDIDDLWEACTDPDRLARWIAEVSGDLRVGGHRAPRLHQHLGRAGVIETCEAPHHLLLTTQPGTDEEGQVEAWLTAEGCAVPPRGGGARPAGRAHCTSTARAGRRTWRTCGPHWSSGRCGPPGRVHRRAPGSGLARPVDRAHGVVRGHAGGVSAQRSRHPRESGRSGPRLRLLTYVSYRRYIARRARKGVDGHKASWNEFSGSRVQGGNGREKKAET